MTRKKKPISKLSKREEDFAIREQQLAQRAENIFRLSSPFAGQTQAYYNFQKMHGAPSNGLSTYSEIFRNNYPVQQITAHQNIREAVSRETQTIPQSGNISVDSQPSNGLSAFATNQRRPRSNEDINIDLTETQSPPNLVPQNYLDERANQARQIVIAGDSFDPNIISYEQIRRESPDTRSVGLSVMTPPPLRDRIMSDVDLARSFLMVNASLLPYTSAQNSTREWEERIHSYRDPRKVVAQYVKYRHYFAENGIRPNYPEGKTERDFGRIDIHPTQSQSLSTVIRQIRDTPLEIVPYNSNMLEPLAQQINNLSSLSTEILRYDESQLQRLSESARMMERNPQGSTASRSRENENEKEEEKVEYIS